MPTPVSEDLKLYLSKKLPNIKLNSVQAVLTMVEEGATVPFMARYRKEKTGNLDETEIRAVIDEHEKFQEIVKRKAFILVEIEKQNALTPEIKKQIVASMDLAELEELYRPYKRKKKTKATLAKEAGLEPLANWIWQIGQGEIEDKTTLEVKAKEFLKPALGYATYEDVLRGAQHILVETLSAHAELRKRVREEAFENGMLVSEKGTKYKSHSKFEMYADYKERAKNLFNSKNSHRYLALKRGWQEDELKVSLLIDEDKLLSEFVHEACKNKTSHVASFLQTVAKISLTVHVIPSISNELHRQLKETADEQAINVFAENVRRVLMGSPFGAKVVLGVDPGLKTGCKLALVDNSGKFISSTVLHILAERDFETAKKLFSEVLSQIKIEIIAVGNGTGGREAEKFIRKVLKEIGQEQVPVNLVNESGASVYSASEVARDEFPDLDITVRGAISIARRLQDPLAELVKIDPKSIGVGQYQHDVPQTKLKKSLHAVVESCVNQVGVDLNTASESLLQYVSGIGPALAKNIVKYRSEKGLFKERMQLMDIPHFSSKVFEQSAGFLRVFEGPVLDKTGVHPESYQAIKDMAQELGLTVKQLLGENAKRLHEIKEKWVKLVGEFTFNDIIAELEKPGRDPRDPYKVFQFRDDIHQVSDLEKEMICPGMVTNVTNFGAFVDIGVHQDGLVHISELSHEFVSDPRLVVAPGDIVKVKVLDVDKDKNQISLSMLLTEKPKVPVRASQASKSQANNKPRRTPEAPRRAGKPRVDGKSASGDKRRDQRPGKGKPPGGGKKPDNNRPPKGRQSQPFNNPFAALIKIK